MKEEDIGFRKILIYLTEHILPFSFPLKLKENDKEDKAFYSPGKSVL